MMKQCLQCGKDFEAERSTAKFCPGGSCRVSYNRTHTDEESLPTLTEKELSDGIEVLKQSTTVGEEGKIIVVMEDSEIGKLQRENVCTTKEWKEYHALCENKAQAKALHNLYDNFSAKELVEAGIRPPKWKRHYKTHAEALIGLQTAMKELNLALNTEGFWVTPEKGVEDGKIDYSTWK